jgi:hypothetical protein
METPIAANRDAVIERVDPPSSEGLPLDESGILHAPKVVAHQWNTGSKPNREVSDTPRLFGQGPQEIEANMAAKHSQVGFGERCLISRLQMFSHTTKRCITRGFF